MDPIDELLSQVIQEMPGNSFDSHAVIRQISQHHQRAYVELLAAAADAYPNEEHLFKQVHGQIGRRLKALAADLGLSEGVASASPDMFGNEQSCVLYERR